MGAGRAIVVMGVSGCGKTSVAEGLAAALRADFLEGDRLHPQANIDKMSEGIPLTDADRWPWLDRIGAELHAATEAGSDIVASCSALKRAYRDRLRAEAGGDLAFVFLRGSRDLLIGRMQQRQGHFMPASLLDSQFATLEEPGVEERPIVVDAAKSATELAAEILAALDGDQRQ